MREWLELVNIETQEGVDQMTMRIDLLVHLIQNVAPSSSQECCKWHIEVTKQVGTHHDVGNREQ